MGEAVRAKLISAAFNVKLRYIMKATDRPPAGCQAESIHLKRKKTILQCDVRGTDFGLKCQATLRS